MLIYDLDRSCRHDNHVIIIAVFWHEFVMMASSEVVSPDCRRRHRRREAGDVKTSSANPC